MNKLYPYDEEMRACMQNFLRARVTVTADDEEVLRKTAEDATAKFGSRRLKKK